MAQIPQSYTDILQKKAFAHVATIDRESGKPQVTPVWVDYDGEHIMFNTVRGRVKDRNLQANPSVSISVQDPDNPYRYIGIQGTVADVSEEGAVDHIHKLSQKYTGQDYSDVNESDVRVIYRIKPENAWTMG